MLGFLNINKPSGISSNFVLTKIKKKFDIKKIGHMGTLDPLASGVLPIAIGKATRMFDYFLNKSKSYYAEFEFGYETSTLDSEGEVISKCDFIPSVDDIKAVLPKFIGEIYQMPPNFSAKKINGANAYDLARKNIDFELRPCKIEIKAIDLVAKISETKYAFNITCGSGTYIRAIGRDIAKELNTYATMTKLIRTQSGNCFDIKSSIALDDLLNQTSIDQLLIPIDKVFNFNRFNITNDEYIDLKNGLKTIKINPFNSNTFVIHNSSVIGVAEGNLDYLKIKTNLE